MFSSFKKIVKLQWDFFRLSAIADMQVPFNLGIQFFNDILWYTVQILLFEAIYLHVDTLGGWGVAEMRTFLGVLFLVDGIQMVFFSENFDRFTEKVVSRDLDLYLTKPANTQQIMTAQKMQCGYILNAVFALGWLLWSLTLIPGGFPWSRAPLLLVVIPAAVSIFYSTRLIFSTIALVISRAEHFHELYFAFFKMGQRPDWVYGPTLRYVILLIVPVGMMASVPARILVNPDESAALPALFVISVLFFWLANCFWKWSVKSYMMNG